MAGLLDSIKSLIGWKDEDPLKALKLNQPTIAQPSSNPFSAPVSTPDQSANLAVPQSSNIANNIGDLIGSIKTNIGGFLSDAGNSFNKSVQTKQNLSSQGLGPGEVPMNIPTEKSMNQAEGVRKAIEGVKIGPVPVGKGVNIVADLLGAEWNKKYTPEEKTAFIKSQNNQPLTDKEKDIVKKIAFNEATNIGMMSAGTETGNKLISSADELASVIAKEYKTKAGQSIAESLSSVLGKLQKKFNISEDLLNQLDSGPLTGNNFSLERVGKNIELILDEGFKPKKFIEDNIVKASKGIKPKMEVPVVKTPIVPEQQVKLLTGSTQPLTSKQAVKIFNKTGKAYEFKNVVPSSGDTFMGFEPGTDLKKLVYNEKKPMPESQFNSMMKDANAFLKEKYNLKTPAQIATQEVKQQTLNQKVQERLFNEADASMAPDLIDAQGRGGLSVPKEILSAVEKMKDQPRILLNRETPGRNIEDVAGKEAPAFKKFFFDRVGEDTAKVNSFVSKTRSEIQDKIVNKLGIKAGSIDDELIMRWGESDKSAKTLVDFQQKYPQIKDWNKIQEADKYFRTLYDSLLTDINKHIQQFGYDPIQKRNDYYTHFKEIGNVFDIFGTLFQDSKLPSYLSGLTSNFRPGKQFFRFAQPRLGTDTTYSAIGAIDKYLEPAANQIFRTETIQRGRLLDKVMRETLEKDTSLAPNHLADFTAWMTDYVNTLSGKKTEFARATESMVGRDVYGAIKAMKRQTSANLVAGNISSAMTNFIPLTQSLATTDKKAFVKGLIEATAHPITEASGYMIDGIQSQFLRNRYASDKLAPTLWENVGKKAGWLFETVDRFVANTITSGKYYEALAKGMEKNAAMKVADDYASRLMADRSFGQMPQVFNDQGLLSLFTQFQLEVNNQVSFMMKDIPNIAEGSKKQTASMLGQLFLYSWLFNNTFSTITGRRPAFDPVDMALNTAKELNSDKTPDQKAMAIGKNVVSNLPFIQILTSGGRIPLMAGFPTLNEITDNPLQAALKPALIFGAPAGGYQVYKGMQGLQDFTRGYEQDRNQKVRYPIEQSPANLIRSLLFGSYSFPEAVKYFDENQTSLGFEDSSLFKQLQARDPKAAKQYYDSLMVEREMSGAISGLSEGQNKLKMQLSDPNISQEEKNKLMDEYQKQVQSVMDQTNSKLKSIKPQSQISSPRPQGVGSLVKPIEYSGPLDIKQINQGVQDAINNPSDGSIAKLLSSLPKKAGKAKKVKITAPKLSGRVKFKVPLPKSSGVSMRLPSVGVPKIKAPTLRVR